MGRVLNIALNVTLGAVCVAGTSVTSFGWWDAFGLLIGFLNIFVALHLALECDR